MKSPIPFLFAACLLFSAASCSNSSETTPAKDSNDSTSEVKNEQFPKQGSGLDTGDYNKLMDYISNGDTTGRWPVKHEFPVAGAILPFKRIIAYYGNLYSKQMGILGEFPKDSMFARLKEEVDKWTKADSLIPAVPALHYIAVTAQ